MNYDADKDKGWRIIAMEKLEAFLRKYFPDEFGEFFGDENVEDKAIRILCYLHESRKNRAHGVVISGVMAWLLSQARKTLEKVQSGSLSAEEAAYELSEALDSMTKDALVKYVAHEEAEGAAPGQPCNDRKYIK